MKVIEHPCTNHKRREGTYFFEYRSNGQPKTSYFCDECAQAKYYTVFNQPLQKVSETMSSRCTACHGLIESGCYCEMCLSIAHCEEQIATGYQQFLATIPRYEDEIGAILDRVNRFEIPPAKLPYFQQALCEHHFSIELHKGEGHVLICQTCGLDMCPF